MSEVLLEIAQSANGKLSKGKISLLIFLIECLPITPNVKSLGAPAERGALSDCVFCPCTSVWVCG